MAARALLGVPAGELANRTVGLETLLGRRADDVAERLHGATGAEERFELLDTELRRALAGARHACRPDVLRAWALLVRSTSGRQEWRAPASARRSSSSSSAKRSPAPVAPCRRSAISSARRPSSDSRPTVRFASSPAGTPSSARAATGSRSICTPAALPSCRTRTGRGTSPPANERKRSPSIVQPSWRSTISTILAVATSRVSTGPAALCEKSA